MLTDQGIEQRKEKATSRRENKLIIVLFFISIVLVPFQNTYLQYTHLRYLGASLAFLPMLALCFYCFFYRMAAEKNKKAELYLLVLLFYSLIPNIWGILVINTDVSLSGAFLVKKTITNTILNILLLYPAFVMPVPTKWYKNAVYIALFIAILGYFFVDFVGFPGIGYPSFFQSSYPVTSPRGFSLEQSTFASTLAILFILSIAFANNKSTRFILILLMVVFTFIITASKGTVLSLFAAFSLSFIVMVRKKPVFSLVGILIVAILFYLSLGLISERFSGEFQKQGSVSTRMILVSTVVPSVVENPLGVGYSGYSSAIIKYASPTSSWIRDNLFPSFGTREIDRYIADEEKKALNIKAQIVEYVMVFGLPGMALIIMFHVNLYRRICYVEEHQRFYFKILFWFLLLSLLTYIPALGLYIYTIAYGALMSIAIQKENLAEKNGNQKIKEVFLCAKRKNY